LKARSALSYSGILSTLIGPASEGHRRDVVNRHGAASAAQTDPGRFYTVPAASMKLSYCSRLPPTLSSRRLAGEASLNHVVWCRASMEQVANQIMHGGAQDATPLKPRSLAQDLQPFRRCRRSRWPLMPFMLSRVRRGLRGFCGRGRRARFSFTHGRCSPLTAKR